MKTGTYLEIDLDKIRDNSKIIVEKCRPLGIEVLGVTKGFSAKPRIVKAMIQGGITDLADSRLENIIALRKKGFTQGMTLLRIPRLSAVKKVITFTEKEDGFKGTVIFENGVMKSLDCFLLGNMNINLHRGEDCEGFMSFVAKLNNLQYKKI